jgi:hypothetical protein
VAREKKNHMTHMENHAKHHQMLEETHIECWRKDSHGDHQGTKEAHPQNVGEKKDHMIITWKTI